MRWFRHRTGPGTTLALLAMALQLVLTLGHTHAGELASRGLDAGPAVTHTEHADGHDHHEHSPDHLCPDCLVLAQAATGLTAAPPTTPTPATVSAPLAVLRILTDSPARRCAGFRPRAPPHS